MVETKRVYKLEDNLYRDSQFNYITKQRPLSYLKKYAQKIWEGEGNDKPLPEIRFGKGVQNFSWCDGETIELAKSQRDILTLVHELVHALGYDHHDNKFIRRELKLIEKYTPVQSIIK